MCSNAQTKEAADYLARGRYALAAVRVCVAAVADSPVSKAVCRVSRWLTPIMCGWGGSRKARGRARRARARAAESLRRGAAPIQARELAARVRGDGVRGTARGGALPAEYRLFVTELGDGGPALVIACHSSARRATRAAERGTWPDRARTCPGRATPKTGSSGTRSRPDWGRTLLPGTLTVAHHGCSLVHPAGRDRAGPRAAAQPGLRRGNGSVRGRGRRLPGLVRAVAGRGRRRVRRRLVRRAAPAGRARAHRRAHRRPVTGAAGPGRALPAAAACDRRHAGPRWPML